MSATIVFRGLMAFHMMNDVMEIGFLQDGRSGHVPRIITTKDGVISSILDLRTVDDFGEVRDWEINVTNPLQDKATKFEQGEFNRPTHPHARDFRWIVDLEGRDLHNRDLTSEIDTRRIPLVLRVPHGEFYTRLLTKPLMRKSVHAPGDDDVFYGMAAEVIGCDIAFNIGKLRLKAGNSVVLDLEEGVEDGVIYEFSNAPPDVPKENPHPNGGHFHMYYHELFRAHHPPEQFDFVPEDDSSPAPDPATCGGSYFGKRSDGI